MFEEKHVRPRVTRATASVNSGGGKSVLVVMSVVGHLKGGMRQRCHHLG